MIRKLSKLALFTTLLVLASCEHYHTQGELHAMGIAKTFSKDAQMDYLQCQNYWPNEQCLQRNWDKYGNIEFKGYSNIQKLEEAKNYFEAMALYGAQHLLQESGYQCKEITSWRSIILSSDYYAFCDNSKRYRFSSNGENWSIISTSNMTSK